MIATWSVKISRVENTVWSGLAMVSSAPFAEKNRGVYRRLLLPLLPAWSSVLQLLVAFTFSPLDSFSDSVVPADVCRQFPAVWVDVCEFQVELADIWTAKP